MRVTISFDSANTDQVRDLSVALNRATGNNRLTLGVEGPECWHGETPKLTPNQFADVVGNLVGWHGFDLQPDPDGGDGCRVTHALELESSLSARLRWMAIEPIHDWAVEAMFDRLENALRTGVVPERSERPMSRMAAFAHGLARRVGSRRSSARSSAPASP